MATLSADLRELTPEGARFARRLFEWQPEWRHQATVDDSYGERGTLVVRVPSPTGDPDRELIVWMDDGVEPSVGFGRWHTHAGVFCWSDEALTPEGQDTRILKLIDDIIHDRCVICIDIGKEEDSLEWSVVDLTCRDHLLDELTSPYAQAGVDLRSWGGSADGVVTLETFEQFSATRATES